MNYDGLLKYQPPHVDRIAKCLRKGGIALDGSDTGTGKTYTASCIVREWDPATVVVCPKIAIPSWERKAKEMGADLTAINYEMVRTGRTSLGEWRDTNGIDIFHWHKDVQFVILDEAHRTKGRDTLNQGLFTGAALGPQKVLAMTATFASSPLEMRALGFALGWHDWLHWGTWLRKHGCFQDHFGEWSFARNQEEAEQVMAGLNKQLWRHGSRMLIKDIPGFPKSHFIPELYRFSDIEKLKKLYNEMAEALNELHEATKRDKDPDHHLTKFLRARQESELIKVPMVAELVYDEIDQGRSVAVFTNFRKTVDELKQRLQNLYPSIVVGGQSDRERDREVGIFQANQTHAILCQLDAGSEAIDLHDLYGRPRTSFGFPGLSVTRFKQYMGRLPRAGAKSSSIQRMILAEGVEEDVFRSLTRKNFSMDTLSVSDLFPVERYQIKVEKDYE